MSTNSLTHDTPGDLMRDEEKWFKFLSKKNMLAMAIASVPGLLFFTIFKIFGHPIIGAVIWGVLVIIGFALTKIVLPVDKNTYTGGGQYLYMILIRRIFRKITRTTYIKNYNRFTEVHEED